MIYADFDSILVPDDNGKQNPNDSDTNKYRKYIPGSWGHKLVCIGDPFSKSKYIDSGIQFHHKQNNEKL